jgi:hypothetical protein
MGISKDDQAGENGWQTKLDKKGRHKGQAMPRTNKVRNLLALIGQPRTLLSRVLLPRSTAYGTMSRNTGALLQHMESMMASGATTLLVNARYFPSRLLSIQPMSGNKRKIATVNASLSKNANQLSMKVIQKILIKYHRVSDYPSLKQHCQPDMMPLLSLHKWIGSIAYQVKERKARHDEVQEIKGIQGHTIHGNSHDEWNNESFHS